MVVIGLVVTVEDGSLRDLDGLGQRLAACAPIELGELMGNKLPVVMEVKDVATVEACVEKVGDSAGVLSVDFVFGSSDDEGGSR